MFLVAWRSSIVCLSVFNVSQKVRNGFQRRSAMVEYRIVQRYSESIAVPLKFPNLGGVAKKFFAPETLHQVSATGYV